MILPADKVVATLENLGLTHVVWLPDSALGPWEHALAASRQLSLLRVTREGEAWTLAAGLYLGGKTPARGDSKHGAVRIRGRAAQRAVRSAAAAICPGRIPQLPGPQLARYGTAIYRSDPTRLGF